MTHTNLTPADVAFFEKHAGHAYHLTRDVIRLTAEKHSPRDEDRLYKAYMALELDLCSEMLPQSARARYLSSLYADVQSVRDLIDLTFDRATPHFYDFYRDHVKDLCIKVIYALKEDLLQAGRYGELQTIAYHGVVFARDGDYDERGLSFLADMYRHYETAKNVIDTHFSAMNA